MALSLAIVAYESSVYLPVIEKSHRFDWRVRPPERKKAKVTDSRTRCMAFWRESGVVSKRAANVGLTVG
jgi:hypothetical protein